MGKSNRRRTEESEKKRSLDELILQWFIKPGNFERYLKADGRAKVPDAETKSAMALELIDLQEQSGLGTRKRNSMVSKLSLWQRRYLEGRRLALLGSNERTIRKACPFYFRVVDTLGDAGVEFVQDDGDDTAPHTSDTNPQPSQQQGEQNGNAQGDKPSTQPRSNQQGVIHIRRNPQPYSTRQRRQPIRYIEESSSSSSSSSDSSDNDEPQRPPKKRINTNHQRPAATTTTIIPQDSNPTPPSSQYMLDRLHQQNQELLEQQTRIYRIQEMQAQATLIQRMQEAGFTKDEITENLQYVRTGGST